MRGAPLGSSSSLVILWDLDQQEALLDSSSDFEVEKLILVEKLGRYGHLSRLLLEELRMLGIINKKAQFSLENH